MRPGRLPMMLLVLLAPGAAQDPARDRLAREATAQATEADKLFKLGRYAEALPLYRSERTSRAELKDGRYEAYALRGIACCLSRLGEVEEAIEALQAARAIDLKSDDKGLAGYDALLMGRGYAQIGEQDKAVAEAKFALGRFERGEDRDHEAEARLLLGRVLLDRGEIKDAAPEIERGLSLAESLELPLLLAEAWAVAGALDRAEGRPGAAFERLDDARRLYSDEAKEPIPAVKLELEIADLLVDLGRPEAAEARFESAAAELVRLEADREAGEAFLALAGIRLDLDDRPGAVEAAGRALDHYRRVGSKPDEVAALVVEAQAKELAGDRDGAFASIEAAAELGTRVNFERPEEIVRLSLAAAEAARRFKKADAAERHLAAAAKAAKRSGDSNLKAQVEKAAERGRRRTVQEP